MAKYLDAMARARQQRTEGAPSPHPAAARPSPADGDAPLVDPVPSSDIRDPHSAFRNASPPAFHPGLAEEIVGAHDARSPITEQVRHIRTNLESVLGDYQSRLIVISSPVPGDGKTLFTANLATVLADDPRHQVLLVDADLRKPDMHRLFGIARSPGLTDFLEGKTALDESIHPTTFPNLSIMPAGQSPANPTTLLGSERMRSLMNEAQQAFAWILFDTPPLLPVTDASIVARESTGMILVVRMGQTVRPTVERTQELLAEMRLPILGCVLNDYTGQSRDESYYYTEYGRKDRPDGFVS